MNRYLIQSLGGLSMGMWKAPSPQEALLQFYRKRGYKEDQIWIENEELAFADDALDIFGNSQNTWLVERLN